MSETGDGEFSKLFPPVPSKSDGADIDAILERIEGCVKDISLGFERWDDPYARGPGLSFVVERDSMAEFAAPMGDEPLAG